jgi:hypothetical protein
MFERGIEMCFFPKLYHFREMLMINVGIDTEKALQYGFGYR